MTKKGSKAKRPMNIGRIKHLVKEAERQDAAKGPKATLATGFTLLKFVSKPIARLVEDRDIGPAEYMAAQEFFTCFNAITGGLWIKPQSLELRDPSYGSYESPNLIDAQQRYRKFVDHWSIRAKTGDRTLAILVAAVVDERPFYIIEDDVGVRHGKARKAVIRGLRDYAARAGWVSHQMARAWMGEAMLTFQVQPVALSLAVARARTGR